MTTSEEGDWTMRNRKHVTYLWIVVMTICVSALSVKSAMGAPSWDIPILPYGPDGATVPDPAWTQSDGPVYQNMWYSMHQEENNAALTSSYTNNEWKDFKFRNTQNVKESFRAWRPGTDTSETRWGHTAHNNGLTNLRVSGPGEDNGGKTGRQMVIMWAAPEAGEYEFDLSGSITQNSAETSSYGRLEVFKINSALDSATSEDVIYMNTGSYGPTGGSDPDVVESFDNTYTFNLVDGERIGVRLGSVAGANSVPGGAIAVEMPTCKVTAIPEPATASVLIGAIGLSLIRKR